MADVYGVNIAKNTALPRLPGKSSSDSKQSLRSAIKSEHTVSIEDDQHDEKLVATRFSIPESSLSGKVGDTEPPVIPAHELASTHPRPRDTNTIASASKSALVSTSNLKAEDSGLFVNLPLPSKRRASIAIDTIIKDSTDALQTATRKLTVSSSNARRKSVVDSDKSIQKRATLSRSNTRQHAMSGSEDERHSAKFVDPKKLKTMQKRATEEDKAKKERRAIMLFEYIDQCEKEEKDARRELINEVVSLQRIKIEAKTALLDKLRLEREQAQSNARREFVKKVRFTSSIDTTHILPIS